MGAIGMGQVGVDPAIMEDACGRVRMCASNIDGHIADLNRVASGLGDSWTGRDLETLTAEFTSFSQKLSELPGVIESIAAWGESTTQSYVQHENASERMFAEILH